MLLLDILFFSGSVALLGCLDFLGFFYYIGIVRSDLMSFKAFRVEKSLEEVRLVFRTKWGFWDDKNF